ncbi:MAG: hypothetical protein KA313_01415 [Pseudarcicella sp.]|nr:hypothetical protein [Pseudarcicella sp.]MBP6409734.1 hypothetical protein [Pseudarcicella sp.]
MKYVTIVNRHYPPSPGITGEAAWDLAKHLIECHQITPIIIHISRNYHGGGAIRQPIGEIHSIRTIYKGENEGLKILAGFCDGLFLIFKTLLVKKGPVIVMTSPPLLPFWANWFFKLFQTKWLLWSMDLFPEGFVATNTISKNNLFYRFFQKASYTWSPQKIISLGENQANYLNKLYQKNLETIVLPCGVLINQEKDNQPPEWKKDDNKIYFGYCGNLGDPHSEDFLIDFIKHINPSEHHLILAIYGKKANKVLEFAKNIMGITILTNVPRAQLHFIDIHLVSLQAEWTHIAVPSKAVSSVCAGGAILFCGKKESDTWHLLQDAAWHIDIEKNINEEVKCFFENISIQAMQSKKHNAEILSQNLQTIMKNAYSQIANEAE